MRCACCALQMLRAQDSTSVAARDVLEVFAPLADQLGVWSLKAELEDLAFQALHPREYAELRAQFQANLQLRTIEHSLETLKEAVGHRGISNVDLVGRPKNLYSVWKKMQNKKYNLEQLYDLRALRIVVRSKADCYWALREVSPVLAVALCGQKCGGSLRLRRPSGGNALGAVTCCHNLAAPTVMPAFSVPQMHVMLDPHSALCCCSHVFDHGRILGFLATPILMACHMHVAG